MDLHSEAILQEYRENLESYQIAAQVLKKTLQGFVDELDMLINSVDVRVKKEKSLAGKLDLKGSKYKDIFDITDIVGARVVTFYADEVDKVATKVISSFDVDWENSIDKRKIYKVDQFGYMSLHYIVKIPKELFFDEKHPHVNDFKYEIQLRTTLQHTWATVYHDTGYKNDVEVPSEYLRRLNRLAGLLELADEEFMAIRDDLNAYRKKVKSVIKSGKFEDVEINGDSHHAYVENGGYEDLLQRCASINNMDIERHTSRNFIGVYRSLGLTNLKEVDDIVKNYSDLAYRLFLLQYEIFPDMDIITSNIAPLNLLFVYLMDKGYGIDTLILLINTIQGERKSNVAWAKRVYKFGITLGIVKEAIYA